VRRLDLVRDTSRTMLVLEGEGHEPIETLLCVPIDMGRFLRSPSREQRLCGRWQRPVHF
jgi:hypothetical protein